MFGSTAQYQHLYLRFLRFLGFLGILGFQGYSGLPLLARRIFSYHAVELEQHVLQRETMPMSPTIRAFIKVDASGSRCPQIIIAIMSVGIVLYMKRSCMDRQLRILEIRGYSRPSYRWQLSPNWLYVHRRYHAPVSHIFVQVGSMLLRPLVGNVLQQESLIVIGEEVSS